MKSFTFFIILIINLFHYTEAQTYAECLFIQDNAFEIFPVKYVKQQIYYNTDGEKFSITHFDAEGNIKKVVMFPGDPREIVINQKKREANRNLFGNEIIEEKLDNNGDITYKKQTDKFKIFEVIEYLEYNDRKVSKKIVDEFKFVGGRKIQIKTTTYNYNSLNHLLSKRIEFTDDFIQNHNVIYPEYESTEGKPRNHIVTYDYVDNGLIKDVTVEDFKGLTIEKLNVYYSKMKIMNFYLISEIIIQNNNNEIISKSRYEYK
jgi:hypothetical protein